MRTMAGIGWGATATWTALVAAVAVIVAEAVHDLATMVLEELHK